MNKIGRSRSFSQSTHEVIGNNFSLGVPRTIVPVVYILYVVFCYALVVHPVLQSLDSSKLKDAVSSFIPSFFLIAITRFKFRLDFFLFSSLLFNIILREIL